MGGAVQLLLPPIEVFMESAADKNSSPDYSSLKTFTMASPPLGWALLLTNLVLCHLAVSLSTSSPALSTFSATLATLLLFLGKKRVPVIALWPITALAVIGQTFATSSLTSVPVTVMLSPIISLVQGFLAIPL